MIWILGLIGAALLVFGSKRREGYTFEPDDRGLVTLAPEGETVTLEPSTMAAWLDLVKEWPEALRVKDSYRPTGGAKKSTHKQGRALDVEIPAAYRAGREGSINWRRLFVGAAQRAGFRAFGLGYGTIHIDTGPPRWWTYSQGSDVGYPQKLEDRFADRVPEEFRISGQAVPDLTGYV